MQIPTKVAEELLDGVAALAGVLISKAKFAGPKGRIVSMIGRAGLSQTITAASKLGSEQLQRVNSEALAKRDYLRAVLTRFALDLDDGEDKQILLRSRK